MPTKWVKFIFAIFLLPICGVLTQTFFTAFARATVTQRLWAGEEFWFFSLGAVLWLIAFFGLPRPILIYVFGHELTHALWVWLMGGRVSRFRVGPRRRTCGDHQGELLDRAGAVFLPDLQHSDDRHLRRAQPFSKHAAVWAAALRGDRRHVGVPFHVHLLDDPQESDRSHAIRAHFFRSW